MGYSFAGMNLLLMTDTTVGTWNEAVCLSSLGDTAAPREDMHQSQTQVLDEQKRQ